MKLKSALICALFAVPAYAFAGGPCFTVYGADNKVIYRSDESPIDLSRAISVEMAKVYPGGHLVTAIDAPDCNRVDLARQAKAEAAAANAPRSAAASNGAPALRMAKEYIRAPRRDGSSS
ncbi:MAG: hypothetical protein ABI589_02895 [Burkholderiales bacterium]